MKKSLLIIIILISIIGGFFVGHNFQHFISLEKKPIYWVDTMEPTIHYPGPGKSRMGMELVPVYSGEQGSDQSIIRISPVLINNLGVRTAPVIQGALARRVDSVGYIEPNENKISHIHSYADGWVRKLFVNSVGASVKKDQVILQLYSPMLINAQEEYLLAVNSNDKNLADASIKKLQALHLSSSQIQQLKNTKISSQVVDIISPQNGVLTELNVREGMHITPDMEMMSIVDLSSVWMIAQVFEDQASLVKIGAQADAKLSAYPDKVWKGNVEYVYPQVDPMTRTLKIRFRFNNADQILKPNMYANISLFTEPKSNVLSMPTEALIRSSRGNRVVVSLGNGNLQVRSVMVGMESGAQVEILSGLKVGERVVTSGQFLIDSESNLNAGLERYEK